MRLKRAVLLIALAGCTFTQRHPAITAGIVGGIVGGLACELDNPSKQTTCAILTGGAAVFLGGITGIVTLFADTSAHELVVPGDEDDDKVHVHTSTPPPPVPLDAGIEVSVDAGLDAP